MNELTVTVVGRSGVGKSSLINALVGAIPSPSQRPSDQVPRSPSVLVDTPGLDNVGAPSGKSQNAVEPLLNKSDLILFVVDSSSGRSYDDRMIAELLHRLGKPVILVINKIDMLPSPVDEGRFSELGFEKSVQVSVRNNLNIDNLLYMLASPGVPRVNHEYLLLRAHVLDVASIDKAVAGLVDLYRALNALHIDN